MFNALTRISRAQLQTRAEGFLDIDPQGYTIVRGDNPTEFQRTGRSVRIQGWERHPVVQACARVIADIVGAVDFEAVKTAQDGDIAVIEDHPAAELLQAPRVGMNDYRLRALTALHYVVYGNAFWNLQRENRTNPGSPINAINLVHPEMIQYVYLDPDTLEVNWIQWRDRVGRSHMSSIYDFVHFKDLSGGDFLFGYPRAASALVSITADDEASQYVREIVTNHGLPGAIIRVNDQVTDEQMRKQARRFKQIWSQRGQRGATAFLRGAEELIQVGFNLENLEFPQLRSISRQDICSAFGVDPRMVGSAAAKGSEGGLSGQQYREARFRLIQQTVMPVMKAMEAELDIWFMPEFAPEATIRFSAAGLAELTEDEAGTSTRMIAEVEARIRTREEARDVIGLPVDMAPTDHLVGVKGGDDYTVREEAQRSAASLAAKLMPPSSPFGGGAPSKNGDGADPKEPKEPAEPGNDPTPARIKSRFMSRTARAVLTPAMRLALWQDFDRRATQAEQPYLTAAALLFRDERDGVIGMFNAEARAVPGVDQAVVASALQKIQTDYAPGGAYHRAWLDRYLKLIGQTFAIAGENVAAAGSFAFDLKNPRVAAAVHDRAKLLADFVTKTTADQVSVVIEEGWKQGLGMRQIADLLDHTVFGDQAQARAVMIARTETVGALNQGEYVTARESDVFTKKEWLTQGDDRVRPEHAEYAQEGPVDMHYEFSPGLNYPGDQRGAAEDVINCRCTLLYYSDADQPTRTAPVALPAIAPVPALPAPATSTVVTVPVSARTVKGIRVVERDQAGRPTEYSLITE